MSGAEARIAVVTALPEEARAIARELGVRALSALAAERASLVVAWTGDGASRAGRNLALLLNRIEPDRLIGCGVAGALTEDLPRRTIVRPAAAFDEAGNRAELAEGTAGTLIVSVARPLTGSAEKQRLAANLGVKRGAIVDLETLAWVGVAGARHIPFSAVRIVLDAAKDELPEFLREALRPDGSIDRRAVALAALLRPARIPRLARLRRDFRDACDALASAVAPALRQRA